MKDIIQCKRLKGVIACLDHTTVRRRTKQEHYFNIQKIKGMCKKRNVVLNPEMFIEGPQVIHALYYRIINHLKGLYHPELIWNLCWNPSLLKNQKELSCTYVLHCVLHLLDPRVFCQYIPSFICNSISNWHHHRTILTENAQLQFRLDISD